MISNYWEDKNMNLDLKKNHNKIIKQMKIPDWALFDCPFCNEKLDYNSIRNIGLCLNARNIGDVSVEFCCDKCSRMDTMYFRKASVDIAEFASMVTSSHADVIPPVIEEKMFKMQYNNLMEIIHLDKE